jgi:outer membrane protein OmpA-like peptidoglycan-associated protein
MGLIDGLDLEDLGNIAGIFGGGQSKVDGLMNSGGGILDMLLGNKTSGIVDLIAGMAGLKSSSSSSILKMAAPFLLGLIGKQIKGKGVGALTDLLMGQKSSVASALPSGVGSLLGLSSLSNMKAPEVSAPSGGGGMGWLKWLLPLLLLLGLGWWMMKNNAAKKAAEAAAAAEAKLKMEADSIAAAAAKAAASMFDKTLSSGFKLVGAAPSGIESQLVGFVEDASKVVDKTTWFNFDRLLFDSAKSTLQPSSQEQLVNIAEILKAFPKVNIKIGGYTDNVGDDKANMKLSADRANTVMNELIKLGIDKKRLEAEGYGEQHPVASNDTEEGRQQNRRIAVRVTQK